MLRHYDREKKKTGREAPAGEIPSARLAGFFYIGGLGAFRSLDNFKFDRVSFLQRAVTVPDDGRVMNKDIGAIIASDEPIAFGVIEPFHDATHLDSPPERMLRMFRVKRATLRLPGT